MTPACVPAHCSGDLLTHSCANLPSQMEGKGKCVLRVSIQPWASQACEQHLVENLMPCAPTVWTADPGCCLPKETYSAQYKPGITDCRLQGAGTSFLVVTSLCSINLSQRQVGGRTQALHYWKRLFHFRGSSTALCSLVSEHPHAPPAPSP